MWLKRCAASVFCLLAVALWSPQVASADWLHRVAAGDTWSSLAKRFKVSTWDLALANKLTPDAMIHIDQELRVPPAGVVYVRPGQSLTHIARAKNCSVADLLRVNRLRSDQSLRAGSRLWLPGYKNRRRRARSRSHSEVSITPLAAVAVRRADEVPAPSAPAGYGTIRLTMGGEPGHAEEIQLINGQGQVLDSGLSRLSAWMAKELPDGAQPPQVHPRLAMLLARISEHFDGRELQLFSGFRKQGGNTSATSRHVVGRAADILVTGVSKRAVWEFCRSLDHTGCGFYPRSLFVHVDARSGAAQWVDWSRPGQRARYGSLRGPFWRGKRGRGRPRVRITRTVKRPNAVPLEVVVLDDSGQQTLVSDARPPAPTTAPAPLVEDGEPSLAASSVPVSRLPVSTAFKLLSDSPPAPSGGSDSI